MKVRDLFLGILTRASSVCVGMSLVFFIVAQIASSSRLEGELGISFSQYLLFILFSFAITGAGYLFRLPLPYLLNLLIHYAVCLLSFIITFMAVGKLVATGGISLFVFAVVFTVFYAVCFGLYLLLRFLLFPEKRNERTKKKKKEAQVYVDRF